MIGELRELNFSQIIKIDYPEPKEYDYNSYKENNYRHNIKGFCVSCEEKGINPASETGLYKLANISHSAHSIDYFMALGQLPADIANWREQPVAFIFEVPDCHLGKFCEFSYKGVVKKATVNWSWIYGESKRYFYPNYFQGDEYGRLIISLLNTLKLRNVYLTSLVKCNLKNEDGDIKGLRHFPRDCIENCINTYLQEELSILKPKVVFTFGSIVDYWVKKHVSYPLVTWNLPHPDGKRRGFTDNFYRVLYFWLIVEGLFRSGILADKDLDGLASSFLKSRLSPV